MTVDAQGVAVLTALRDEPLSIDEALALGLTGWNLRCGSCGSFGARWVPSPAGNVPLCQTHQDALRDEQRRHRSAMRALTTSKHAQATPQEIQQALARR